MNMKRIVIGLSILSVLFLMSCSKEENVAKDYSYTVDEEFLNNDRGWNVFEKDSTYNAKIDSSENGLFEIITNLKTFADFTEGGISSDADYSLETTFTFIRVFGDSKSFSGISWDVVDEDNYMLFSVNEVGDDSRFVVSEIIDGKNPEKNILYEGEINKPDSGVYTLNVQRSDTTLSFIVNGLEVQAIKANPLKSSQIGLYTRKNDVNFHYLRAGI
jgi:hypothetical protein